MPAEQGGGRGLLRALRGDDGGYGESLDIYTATKSANSNSHDPESYQRYRKRFAAGAGTYPLVGTPAHIAAEMVRMSEAGFAGNDDLVRQLSPMSCRISLEECFASC